VTHDVYTTNIQINKLQSAASDRKPGRSPEGLDNRRSRTTSSTGDEKEVVSKTHNKAKRLRYVRDAVGSAQDRGPTEIIGKSDVPTPRSVGRRKVRTAACGAGR